jgi:hypothetical protein
MGDGAVTGYLAGAFPKIGGATRSVSLPNCTIATWGSARGVPRTVHNSNSTQSWLGWLSEGLGLSPRVIYACHFDDLQEEYCGLVPAETE